MQIFNDTLILSEIMLPTAKIQTAEYKKQVLLGSTLLIEIKLDFQSS